MVCYRLIDEEDGSKPYAQVRMAALINEIKPAQQDPATGRTYERYLVSPSKAMELLNWKDDGAVQIHSAVETAKKYLGISFLSDNKIIKI